MLFILALGALVRWAIAWQAPGPGYQLFLDRNPDQCWYAGYQLLVDLTWRAAHGHVAIEELVQVAGSMIAPAATWALARELGLPARRRTAAAAAVCFLPYYLSVATRQPQVGWCISTGALATWLLVRWRNQQYNPVDGARFGAAAIVAAFFRPTMLFAIAGGLVFLRLVDRQSRARVVAMAAAITCTLVLISTARVPMSWLTAASTGPWSSYCFKYVTAFPPLSGYNLYVGNGPTTVPFALQHAEGSMERYALARRPFPPGLRDRPDSPARDRELTRLAGGWVLEHPLEAASGFVAKAYKFWEPVLPNAAERPIVENLLYSVPYLLYLPATA